MTETSKNLSQVIRNKMREDNKRFWAGDNISEYIAESDREHGNEFVQRWRDDYPWSSGI